MKALGLILKIFAGLVVVLVVAIGVIVATVDPNDYRDEITTAVKENTGRDLTIDNMSLSIFPELAINLEKASLSNAAGFDSEPFVKVEKVQIGAAILPLLSKQLEVETLTLHGLNLNLQKDAQGKTNWDDLTEEKTESEKEDEKHTDDQHEESPLSKLSSLSFGGIDIKDGQISWQDDQNQQQIKLTNLSLTTDSISFGEFFKVALNADTAIQQPEIKTNLQINLEAKIEQSGQFSVQNLVVSNTTSGKGIPVEQAKTTIELPSFSIEGNQFTLPTLSVKYAVKGGKDFPLETVDGDLTVTDFSGDIEAQAFKAKSIALNSEVSGETLPAGKVNLSLNTSAEADIKKQTASIPALNLQAMGLQIQGSATAAKIIDSPEVNAKVELNKTNLRELLNKLKIALPEMSDAKTLTQLAATMGIQFNLEPQSLKIDNLAVQLDDSKLSGKASVANFSAPAVRYNLALDKIDVNRYLPAKKAETAATGNQPTTEESKIELPTEQLRKLDINGTIKVGNLVYDNLKPSNIVITTKAAKGDISLNPVSANIFKTRVNAQAGLNVAADIPKYRFKTNTNNLPIGEVLIAFTGDDRLSGKGTLNADITTAGDRVSAFKQNLNGKVSADLQDGAVKGFNLAETIRSAKAKLSGKTVSASSSEEKTDFSELVAVATIKNGIVTTETLSAKAPFMRIIGNGTVNLPKETLNYLVKTKIVGSDKGQGGAELTELNGLTIPVKLTGSYMDPKIALDLQSLLEQKAKAEIEKKKEEVVEDIKKKAEDKLKDSILKGFKF